MVDTNILLYAADCDSPKNTTCWELIRQWRELPSPWYLTWGIVYEFLRVATHPNVFRDPLTPADAWDFLRAILGAPAVGILTETPRHAEILGQLIEKEDVVRGNVVFDAHTVALMREHGVRTIYTHDADFHRFSGLEVVDPL